MSDILNNDSESDYEFRERIYDATQEISKMQGIHIVRAKWDTHEVFVLDNRFTAVKDAYAYLETVDNGDPHYIIGADIEDV